MAETDASAGPTLPHGKLLEGIVTTLNADGSPNIAPMGPIVDANFERLLLRPFRTSVTYRNLKRAGEGVLHVTDDVELFARAAVGQSGIIAGACSRQLQCDGVILSDACRWYAFRVESLDDREERTTIVAKVVDRGRLRDFFGFNRAKHAVIEAAILATRIGIVDSDTIRRRDYSSGIARRKNRWRAGTAGFPIPAAVRARGIATGRRNGDAAAMTHAVHVRAPCRLHFGMFSFGHVDRSQFGGVGVMIDPPAVELTFTPAARFNARGTLAERTTAFVEMAAASWRLPSLPACEICVRSPRDHIGLGVGTQLGLSVAAGLRRFLNLPELPVEALAADVGRGMRSAVGTHGFQRGGLIVDSGHRSGQPVGKLARRIAVPEEWRFVLVVPVGPTRAGRHLRSRRVRSFATGSGRCDATIAANY